MNGHAAMVACMWGYISAKIEECEKRDPVPQEISAWEEMKSFLQDQLSDLAKAQRESQE